MAQSRKLFIAAKLKPELYGSHTREKEKENVCCVGLMPNYMVLFG